MFKVVRILLSLIGLNLCVSTEATATQDDIPSIATMSFPSLIEFLTHPQTKTLPLNYLTAATKRLYEIHYFDHRIPLEHRSAAKPVLDTIIGTVKSALKGNPEGLQAYEKANRFMEEKVPIFGYGSLAWKLEEESIPSEHVVSYILQPQNEDLISNFKVAIGTKGWQQIKPNLIHELFMTRRDQFGRNAVAAFHGLVTEGNLAAHAIFTPDELKSIAHAYIDYQGARSLLVLYGLLPLKPSTLPLTPQPPLGMITTWVLLSSKVLREDSDHIVAWHENPQAQHFYESVTSEERELIRLCAMVQRIVLWRSMLKDLYGEKISTIVGDEVLGKMPRSKAQGIDTWFKAYNIAQARYDENPQGSLDIVIAYALMTAAGVEKDPASMDQHDQQFLLGMAQLLKQERALCLDLFRSNLRFLYNQN